MAQQKCQGNLILSDAYLLKLYCFNHKSGMVQEFDLKKNVENRTGQIVSSEPKMLFKEEITSVVLGGHLGSRCAVGFADGMVRIYATGSWDCKDTI